MPLPGPQASEATAASATARRIGSIKAISGGVITLTPDSGPEIEVTVQAGARIVRIAPGEKTLKNATPVELQDLQVGDRILVAGKASDDAKSVTAASIVVMKRSDVEARKEEDRQDWQKRGLGGLVKAVDPAAGTATISVTRLRRRQDGCCAYLESHRDSPLRSGLDEIRRREAQHSARDSARRPVACAR